MAKTFEQVCRDARNDMAADGIYDMGDSSVYYDFAQALLDSEPGFKQLAKKRFPDIKNDDILRECVADCLAG